MALADALGFLTSPYGRDLRLAKWGSEVSLHGSNPDLPMSALGHKRTLPLVLTMSALPPKAVVECPLCAKSRHSSGQRLCRYDMPIETAANEQQRHQCNCVTGGKKII
jgi:hypothetical protein